MLNIETRDMLEMIGYLSEMNDDVRDYLHSIRFFDKIRSYIATSYDKSRGPIYLHQKYSSYIIKSMVEELATKGTVDLKYGPDSIGNYTFQNTWIKISTHTPDFMRTGISLLSGPMSLVKLGDDFKLPDPVAIYNFVTQTIDRYEHSLQDKNVNENFIETLYDFIAFKLDAYAFFTKHIGFEPSEMLNSLRSVINSMSNGYERVINKYKDVKTESAFPCIGTVSAENILKFGKAYAESTSAKYDEFGKEIKKDTSKPRDVVESVDKPYTVVGKYLTEADADMIYRNYNRYEYQNKLSYPAKCEIIRNHESANNNFALCAIITENFNEIDVLVDVKSGALLVVRDATSPYGSYTHVSVETECAKGDSDVGGFDLCTSKDYGIYFEHDRFGWLR